MPLVQKQSRKRSRAAGGRFIDAGGGSGGVGAEGRKQTHGEIFKPARHDEARVGPHGDLPPPQRGDPPEEANGRDPAGEGGRADSPRSVRGGGAAQRCEGGKEPGGGVAMRRLRGETEGGGSS